MSVRRTISRIVVSSLLAIAFLVQFTLPAFSQPYGLMSCCKRSKANCCCHGDKPGVAKIKAKSGCEGGCRFGTLAGPSVSAFPIGSTSSPKIQMALASLATERHLAVHARRFDVTLFQRPPPNTL